MEQVKVAKQELLVRIEANRTKHEAEFTAGLQDYQEARMKELEEHLEMLKRREDPPRCTGLLKPESHLHEYDQVLDMLRMSVDTEITLHYHEFQQYVRDEWAWKRQFSDTLSSSARYLGK